MKAGKCKLGKALCHVQTITYWTCVRRNEPASGLGTATKSLLFSEEEFRKQLLQCQRQDASDKIVQVFVSWFQQLMLISSGCWDDGHIPCFLLLLPTFSRIFYNVYIFISWSNNFYIKARRATRGFCRFNIGKKMGVAATLGQMSIMVKSGGDVF